MKRLTVVALALSLVLGLGVGLLGDTNYGTGSASLSPTVSFTVVGFYAIYIPSGDMSVPLGTIDSSCYNIETEIWCAISDGGTHTVWAFTNNTAGFKLTVTATSTGTDPIDSLADLHIKGGDQAIFTGLDSPVELEDDSGGPGIVKITDIEYEYQADDNDAPGKDYEATLTYTVTSP